MIQQLTPPARARIWPYIVILCLAFAGFVLALMPARMVWQQFSTPQTEVQMRGLQGTLWQGSADWIEWQTHSVQAVRWSFYPWALLRGVWEYQVALQFEGAPVTGFVGRSFFGQIRARDLQSQTLLQDMSYLTSHASVDLPAPVQGDLRVEIIELALSDEWPDALRGQFTLRSLGLAGLAELGDWQGQLARTDNQDIRLQFAPSGDLLQGEGQLTLTPDKIWNVMLKFKPVQAEVILVCWPGWSYWVRWIMRAM
ncbi:MAG: type II secretion system protein N [Pseudomonadota bacterium]